MLVIMRLPETCSQKQQRTLEGLLANMRPSKSQGAWGEIVPGGNNSEDGRLRQEVGLNRGLSLRNPVMSTRVPNKLGPYLLHDVHMSVVLCVVSKRVLRASFGTCNGSPKT